MEKHRSDLVDRLLEAHRSVDRFESFRDSVSTAVDPSNWDPRDFPGGIDGEYYQGFYDAMGMISCILESEGFSDED